MPTCRRNSSRSSAVVPESPSCAVPNFRSPSVVPGHSDGPGTFDCCGSLSGSDSSTFPSGHWAWRGIVSASAPVDRRPADYPLAPAVLERALCAGVSRCSDRRCDRVGVGRVLQRVDNGTIPDEQLLDAAHPGNRHNNDGPGIRRRNRRVVEDHRRNPFGTLGPDRLSIASALTRPHRAAVSTVQEISAPTDPPTRSSTSAFIGRPYRSPPRSSRRISPPVPCAEDRVGRWPRPRAVARLGS